MRENRYQVCQLCLSILTASVAIHTVAHTYLRRGNSGNNNPRTTPHSSGGGEERGPEISQSTNDQALPRLLTQPQVKIVTTSTIEIEWEGAYDGDGPVCGSVVELKPLNSTSWMSVGFVPFNEGMDSFEYTIERLDADALYEISVIFLHCSGSEGERSPGISQSTEDHALPRLLTQPQVKIVTSSSIEVEGEGAYCGDGPVCGYIVELKPLGSKLWMSVGFVPFNEDVDGFEYTIERLDADSLYGISVILLHCSGREGERGPEISQSTEDHVLTALPRLLTQPQVKIVTTSTIEIEWEGDYDGDGPVCGYIVELKPPASTLWVSVGFVPFNEDVDGFEYTIERLDADALYEISVIILQCSGREGERGPEIIQSTEDHALPRLSTQPQVKIVTTSTIEIEWEGAYDGDGPVCGFFVELKPPDSTTWMSVGFVPFNEDVDGFEYTIERLDAGALYGISVTLLHCSGREGERGPEIRQSTEDHAIPRLLTQPQVMIVTTSTIEIEWKGDHDGDGPVCGFVVELKPLNSTSWMSVGFVPFNAGVDSFEYTIERLDAGALYGISVMLLHCSGREGERGPEISQSTEDHALPRLSTPPRVKIVTTSTIEIEWEGAYDGDGPVCGFVVEIKPPTSPVWMGVGFVPFNEGVDGFEYTIERLDADALYGISVIILHCSGREGERGPEISQSTEDHALPRLLTQPQVKIVTTSTIEIEWEGAYDGDGPVCGFFVEIKPPSSASWMSVGFVPFNEDLDGFEYTIERLDAEALYEISVILLHCSGREGERGPEISQSTEDHALPRLLTQPQVKIITTSTIEIEWEGAYDGDGPVCGFVVELKPPASTSWMSVGFVPFNEDVDDFEYTIERLDADALYEISVIILHCSGREGERGPEISQSTEDHALPRLLTQPEVKIVTTSTIEIEWERAYDGDGPVCGFVVELKPPVSTLWMSVGFVPFNEDVEGFEYTIERLDADALYGISVILLHCSGRQGERGPEISQSTEDHALPRLSTQPQVNIVTTSTIEIEWKGVYDGDGPVCGFVVELKPPALTSWTSVGFVPFNEDVDDFEYTIERLDADALYGINVILLHCSGREGERGPEISQSTEDHALPRLSTQPQVKIVTTSTIEIEWKGAYDGDGPVCGFVVELKPPTSTPWTGVGFVPFNEDVDGFEYTIERLDAGAVYGISVIILHCSGRKGERGPDIIQSTEDPEPEDDRFVIAVTTFAFIVWVLVLIIICCFVYICRGKFHKQVPTGEENNELIRC